MLVMESSPSITKGKEPEPGQNKDNLARWLGHLACFWTTFGVA